jgi:hypothetical protein
VRVGGRPVQHEDFVCVHHRALGLDVLHEARPKWSTADRSQGEMLRVVDLVGGRDRGRPSDARDDPEERRDRASS